jgi:hypothetical protein
VRVVRPLRRARTIELAMRERASLREAKDGTSTVERLVSGMAQQTVSPA